MRGFTLIELVLTVALVAILGTIGVLSLLSVRNRQDVNVAARAIIATLREGQSRAITREDDRFWGVRFDKAAKSITVFSGSTCLAETFHGARYLKSNLEFQDPASGAKDVCFMKGSGFLSGADVTITVGVVGNVNVSKTVTIYQNGRID
jgi:prepilin-type N-terminal cleavage/methylation domain-containing protein